MGLLERDEISEPDVKPSSQAKPAGLVHEPARRAAVTEPVAGHHEVDRQHRAITREAPRADMSFEVFPHCL
jgi:hypothetical protein